MTIATESVPESAAKLKRGLKNAEARKCAVALALVAPLAIFLLLILIVPIGTLLTRIVRNPKVAGALPKTIITLKDWDRKGPPIDAAYAALTTDLTTMSEGETMGALAYRLNTEIPGLRSLVAKIVRAVLLAGDQGKVLTLTPGQARAKLLGVDEHWGDVTYWWAIVKDSNHTLPLYLLATLDHRQDTFGHIEATDPNEQIYVTMFLRTFVISTMMTLFALLLSYPSSYWIASLPERHANLVVVIMLIPFWMPILARVTAWIVLLQTEGLINRGLIDLGIIKEPLALLFNHVGVYISMTHILLPLMILPLYSVMKSVPTTYQRAAVSLGSHPSIIFWRVYVPQMYPGIGVGALLVFIPTPGYYITPALLSEPNDQMVSYCVAYFTDVTISWNMTRVLGVLLLLMMLVLYVMYGRFTRPKIRAG